MSVIRSSFVAATVLSLASTGWALNIEPGMWKTTATMKSPMMPQGKTTTQTKCVTKEEAEKDFLATLTEGDSPCKVTERSESGNTLNFVMECPNEMGSAKAKGSFTSNGDSGSGKMDMTMSFQGNTMTFQQTFESKRVGPCE